MSQLPPYLRRLEQELLALDDDAMLLEELDGFIAGLIVCPEPIEPGEWLPAVWGSANGDEPAFDSPGHLNRVLGLVMEHYSWVAGTLIERPDLYAPLFAVDERNDDIIWEVWIEGFERAVKLRPEAWQQLLLADPETARAISGLLALADVASRDSVLSKDECDALTEAAPDEIGPWVVTLHEWGLANYEPAPIPTSSVSAAKKIKVGRNEPCPCGSGKKYKKCCGRN